MVSGSVMMSTPDAGSQAARARAPASEGHSLPRNLLMAAPRLPHGNDNRPDDPTRMAGSGAGAECVARPPHASLANGQRAMTS